MKRLCPPRKARRGHWLLLCTIASGCSQSATPTNVQALLTSGDIAFVCLERGSNDSFQRPRSLDECPDFTNPAGSAEERRLHALLTQPSSGEVAVIDLTPNLGDVRDFEPSQPGSSFLPIGAGPTDIVTTPGGVAAFVGVQEVGREGVFALPGSCLYPDPTGATTRDLTSWAGCQLPVPPGALQLLIDGPELDASGLPTGRVRASCTDPYLDPADVPLPEAANRSCPANLAEETASPGARKLAVALPALSQIWILDAQELLDRQPGSFGPCRAEARLTLSPPPAPTPPILPDSLEAAAECLPPAIRVPNLTPLSPQPADFALGDDNVLYVADKQTSAIHRLHADPCDLRELPPLLASSYQDPSAIIPTRRVAVSPLTFGNQRFVYAVDDSRTASAGTLMAFDVSPGETGTAPLVFDSARFDRRVLPDRIDLGAVAVDVEFIRQDSPPPGDIRVEGVACDPDPALSEQEDLGASYRQSMGPARLRGTFGYVALQGGRVALVDVEDLDAPCRRPISVNSSEAENIFGCQDAPDTPELFRTTETAANTVSGEASCRIVEPHNERSALSFAAPVVSPITLTLGSGRSVISDQSEVGRAYPKLLAAEHPQEATESPFRTALLSSLELDPSLAEDQSVLLTYREPRAHVNQTMTVAYEGAYLILLNGRLSVGEAGRGRIDAGTNAALCSSGVRDREATVAKARQLGVAPSDEAPFGVRHSDYAQWLGSLLDEDDPYWAEDSPGAACGRELFGEEGGLARGGRLLCDRFFGAATVASPEREMRILEAYDNRLIVEPRNYQNDSPERRTQIQEFMACCFPNPAPFQLRAGQQWLVEGSVTRSDHPIVASPADGRCELSCNPLFANRESRVFEISCEAGCQAAAPERAPGPPTERDWACRVADVAGGIAPTESGAACVFENLTTRFAIYRGQQPSSRDMRFQWRTGGGFTPVRATLTTGPRPSSDPARLRFSPQLNRLFVPDGSAPGLAWLSPPTPTGVGFIF